jgi:hypothetical protein
VGWDQEVLNDDTLKLCTLFVIFVGYVGGLGSRITWKLDEKDLSVNYILKAVAC